MIEEKKTRTPQIPPPHKPANYDVADLYAVQMVAAGKANEMQQQRALKWIIEEVAGTYDLGWHPESDHASSFVAGRRFVGLQIVKALVVNTAKLTAKEDK